MITQTQTHALSHYGFAISSHTTPVWHRMGMIQSVAPPVRFTGVHYMTLDGDTSLYCHWNHHIQYSEFYLLLYKETTI